MSDHRPQIFKRIRRYDSPGHAHFLTFSCYRRLALLTDGDRCGWLAAGVKEACMKLDMAIWAYVFMPDHVHLLIKPRRESYRISDFLRALKQSVATKILNRLKRESSPLLAQLRTNYRLNGLAHRFWQAGGGYDFMVWSMEKAVEKARYCHRNPVLRGLVDDPAIWRWSSYGWIEMGLTHDAPLELDPWDEFLGGKGIEDKGGQVLLTRPCQVSSTQSSLSSNIHPDGRVCRLSAIPLHLKEFWTMAPARTWQSPGPWHPIYSKPEHSFLMDCARLPQTGLLNKSWTAAG
jgi:putative transposase